MKNKILLACVMLLGLALHAEDNYPKLPQLSDKQEKEYLPLTPFQAKNGKWGYKDCNGKKVVIKPSFEEAANFKNGGAIVKYNGHYGFVSDLISYTLPPIYEAIEHVGDGIFKCMYRGKYGLIVGISGRILLPCENDVINKENDLFIFQSNGKYGVLHKSGNLKLPCEQDEINHFGDAYYLYKKNHKYGLINKNGVSILPCEQDEIKVEKGQYNYQRGRRSGSEKYTLLIYKTQEKYGMLSDASKSPLISGVDCLKKLQDGVYCYTRGNKYGLVAVRMGYRQDKHGLTELMRGDELREYPTIYAQENSPYVFATEDGLKYDIFVLKDAKYTRIVQDVVLTNYPKNFVIPEQGAQLYDSLANKGYYLHGNKLYSTLEYDKGYPNAKELPSNMRVQYHYNKRSKNAVAAEKKKQATEAQTKWKDMYEFSEQGEEYFEWEDGGNIYSDKILTKAKRPVEGTNPQWVAIFAQNAKTNLLYFRFFPLRKAPIVITETELSKTILDGIDKSKVIPDNERKYIEGIMPKSVGFLPNGNILYVYTTKSQISFNLHQFITKYHEYMGFCIIDIKTGKILNTRLTPLCVEYNYGPSTYREYDFTVKIASSGGFYCCKKFESPHFYSSFYRYSNNGDFEWKYDPEGHTVYEFLDYKKHLILGGSTDKKGYVGFENPAVYLVNGNGIEKEVYYAQKNQKITYMSIQNNQLYWGMGSYATLIPEMVLSNVTVPVTSAPGIPYEKFKMSTVTYAGKKFNGCGMVDDNGEWIIPPIYSFYVNDPKFQAGKDNEYNGYIIEPYDEKTKSVTIVCPDGKSFKKQLNPAGTGYINISE